MTANPSNQDINGLLSGEYWDTNSLTFSFPTAASNYGDRLDGYGAANPTRISRDQPRPAERSPICPESISQYTLLTFTQITETDSDHAICDLQTPAYPDVLGLYAL